MSTTSSISLKKLVQTDPCLTAAHQEIIRQAGIELKELPQPTVPQATAWVRTKRFLLVGFLVVGLLLSFQQLRLRMAQNFTVPLFKWAIN